MYLRRMFQRTTAINKIRNLDKFVKGIQGGTSAGKTYGILPIEIDYCAKNPGTETSVVAESIPHLKRGAMKDFKKIMIQTGRWVRERWNASDYIYTFANGSTIEFFSADQDSKLRGARRDRLYINEANNITFHAYNELAVRTKQSITLDWNPTSPFWFHEELMNDDDVDFIIINYTDNEACPESALKFIEKARVKAATSDYWANWYRVYGLGEIGSLQGTIFQNWKQVDRIPEDAKLVAYGMDFGFTNDPTTLVAVYEYDGEYYLDQLLYHSGLTNPEIARLCKALNLDKSVYIYADCAEPKSIKELKTLGLRITESIKGKDSVNFGIQRMQEKRLNITKRSLDLIKELRNYCWATDRSGASLNVPIDAFNHLIDAVRYALSTRRLIRKRPKARISR